MKTLKQVNYQGCPVIIRQISKWVFEYILLFEGQFYGMHIKNKLKWWQWYRVFTKETTTPKEIQSLIRFLEKAAETTIETLKTKKDETGTNARV